MMMRGMKYSMRRPANRACTASNSAARENGGMRRVARGQRGETITEVLVAMVIVSLALLMLAVVIATSSNIVTKSRNSMESYYETGNALATHTEDAGAGVSKVTGTTISLSNGVYFGVGKQSVPVDVYESDTAHGPVISYEEA